MRDTPKSGTDGCCGSCSPPLAVPVCALGRPWVVGQVDSPVGLVPRMATRWTWHDVLGAVEIRWGIGRRSYLVEPGLYAIGQPDNGAPLLVTANYKLSLDHLRRALVACDAWVLVLDTRGINVWCAAGKGTFGTEELVGRMTQAGVARVVSHRTIILPQLGAPGVAAHDVQRRTGFKVVYGPVRAQDLPAFLHDGLRATAGMRQVDFPLWDRLAVVPVEMVQRFVPAILVMVALCLADGLGRHGYRIAPAHWAAIAFLVWANVFAGVVLTPALLPWLPGRSFAVKGAVMGLLTGALLWWGSHVGLVPGLAVVVLSVAACSFLGLTFTGSTPYTSASGVRREMKWAVPLQLVGTAAGLALWAAAHLI